MYNFDQRNIRTGMSITLQSQLKEGETLNEAVEYYFLIVLDMILGIMNSEVRHLDDAIDEQYLRFPGEYRLPFLAELIRQEVVDIKKQFILAGFDNRLRYKLVVNKVGFLKRYAIAMDIDATYSYMKEREERENNNEQEIGSLVSDCPSAEELNRILNW